MTDVTTTENDLNAKQEGAVVTVNQRAWTKTWSGAWRRDGLFYSANQLARLMATTTDTTSQTVDAMKAEIVELIEAGTVPATVASYSELHDFVDANLLGFEVYGTFPAEDETDAQAEARMDAETPIFNEASTIVDAWLKAGRPVQTWTLYGENTHTGNRWECVAGIATRAEADDLRKGWTRLESDYKISYTVEP